MLEIAVSFVVLVAVAAFALHFAANWKLPLGFEWRDVWAVEVDPNVTSDDTWTEEQTAQMQRLLREVRTLPRVEAAAGAMILPYQLGAMNGNVDHQERSQMTNVDVVTDDFAAVFGMDVAEGRWFSREDDGALHPPAIINRRLAEVLFPDEEAVGKLVERGGQELRVVGVVEDFRQFGELSSAENHVFERFPEIQTSERPPRRMVLRMTPGTPASYEREVLARLAPLVPGWSFEVAPLAQYRQTRLRLTLAPLAIGGVIAFFLLLMVGLGLLGVLWQNVTRRTRELGLRRASGARRAAIHRQILLELVLVTSLALAPALVLVLQLPLLGMLGPLEPAVFGGAVVAALVAIFVLSLLCGLYPSWIAVRSEPAEALRWE
jgi:putative ABC transport system permease protein